MTTIEADDSAMAGQGRSTTWRWYVCVILLLGTVVNYMDRLTVNTLAPEIKADFSLSQEQYGWLEFGFGLAFAAGSILFGWMVDRIGVYWLYPAVLIGWSTMGFLTGLSRTYAELIVLRILLGLFEAGHFPCGLKSIQLLLAPRDRALGNSLLQSGTALGAMLVPLVIKLLLTEARDGWRLPFLVIGAGGTVWVVLWLLSVRPSDLPAAIRAKDDPGEGVAKRPIGPGFLELVGSRRFLALAFLAVCINMNWHMFRAWLPLFLRESRGYDRDSTLYFTSFYYIAADLGALTAGFLSVRLARRGMSVFRARMTVYAGCCLLTTLTTAAALLPKGPALLAALLMVAFGGLGAYAAFYSMTQDLSREHQGKLSGLLATISWMATGTFHPLFGKYLDRTKNYDLVFGVMGWLPAVALVAVLCLWKSGRKSGVDEDGRVAGEVAR